MQKKKLLWGTCLVAASMLSIQTVNAKPSYPFYAPLAFQKDGIRSTATYTMGGGIIPVSSAINCLTCHSSTAYTENNVTTSFGVAFNQYGDDGALATAYNTLAPIDSDGDGFSNTQEAFAGSDLNSKASTPTISLANMTAGDVSAKAITGGAVNTLSLQTGTPVTALGGTVSFTSPYNNLNATALTTTSFMFKAGGAQPTLLPAPAITFYDKNGAPITITPTNTAKSSFIANGNNGSVDVGIVDESVFDIYSTAIFQQEAKDKYNNSPIVIGVAANVPATATVDPYAKVSPLATIEPYAQIDAYAVVNDYAIIGAYAQVGSYAYIGNVDVYTGIDINTNVIVDAYASVDTYVTVPGTVAAKDGKGTVSAKFSVTTTKPTAWLYGTAAAAGDGTSTGGLHCMTTGLGTQVLMFLGLLGAVFLMRRKLS